MKYSQEYWNDVSKIIPNIPNVDRIYNKTILITGATGMICSSVVDVLVWLNKNSRAGIHIALAGRNSDKIARRFSGILSSNEYDYVYYDATHFQTIEMTPDYVVHGASNANPLFYSLEPAETLLGNVVGLQTVLEMVRGKPSSKLLYISSSEVYGKRSKNTGELYDETEYGYIDILNPRSCYPIGKRAAENLCACYEKEYNVHFVIVRPGHVYGPSITSTDTRASSSFARDVANGNNIVMKSSGEQIRSYCYTLDCASAILTVLINGDCGEAYNISNRDSIISIREMADALAKAGNVDVVFENPTDAEVKSYNPMSNSALNSKKIEKLGWRAQFSLAEGAKKTLQFY